MKKIAILLCFVNAISNQSFGQATIENDSIVKDTLKKHPIQLQTAYHSFYIGRLWRGGN